MEMNIMWFFCFPSHDQNERKMRDMASYDIKAVILDNHAEGSLPPGGGLGIFTNRDRWSIFLGFQIRESIFLWVLITAVVFFGLLNKSCILKCFIFSTVFLGPVLFTRCFSNRGSPLLSYIMLYFCKMNCVFECIFAFWKLFFGVFC